MTTEVMMIYGLAAACLIFLIWIVILEGTLEQKEGYIKRIEKERDNLQWRVEDLEP